MKVNKNIPKADIPKTIINILLGLTLSENIPTIQVQTKANVIEIPFNLALIDLASI